ncbi:MAG: AmmeMemoRadiSam system protein B [Candidatus Margulisiibacteriota bacterium]
MSFGFPVFAETRNPAVAGSFYPADKTELSSQINAFLQNVPPSKTKGDIVALIAPHAGYPFSGQVAAYAYKELEARSFDRVIIIGASHHMSYDGMALPDYDSFLTPLGKVPVDKNFINQLKKFSPKFIADNKPHIEEHSIEVHLPFLQTILKDFKIVPILFGNISVANCQALAYALSLLVDDRTLIVLSSDWSHYYPYDTANKLDNRGTDLVVKGDLIGFIKGLEQGECEACGAPAIITAMMAAPALGVNKIELLKYANSGDVTGDKSKVVGYAAIVFSRLESVLSDADKDQLLKIARKTIEALLSGNKTPVFKIEQEALLEKRGAFVTLTEEGRLRGCIGYIQPIQPLAQAVQEMAAAAATKDSRFEPVAKSELKNIKMEISVLSRLKKIKDIQEIEIGRDGLYIIRGDRSGLLLPQVAAEWGWDRDQFLKQVCIKAGLPEDAWKTSDLYRFSAQVFHE